MGDAVQQDERSAGTDAVISQAHQTHLPITYCQ
jgi:hypothetical protein